MATRSFISSESAVSESIGYILIIGIMILAIGAIYVIGYPALQNSIYEAHMQNMERGFIILGNNIDHVVSQNAPKQNVELNLKGGTLKASSTSKIYIKYTDTSNIPWEGWNDEYIVAGETLPPITTIEYVYGDRQVGYEFGGVWENIDYNSYMLKSPKIIVDDPFIIPIVDAGISGGSGMSGEGMAKIIIDQSATSVKGYYNIRLVEMHITSDYYKAWDRYFKSIHSDIPGIDISTIPDENTKTVTVKFEVDTAVHPQGITVYEIKRPIYIDIIA